MSHIPLNIVFTDFPGSEADLRFLHDHSWLPDTAVKSFVVEKGGRYRVSLIIVWVRFLIRFICRYLDHYPTLAKASLHAELFCRTAQKDKCGNLKIFSNDWNLCLN